MELAHARRLHANSLREMDGGRRMTGVSTVTSPASSGAGSMRAPGYRNPSDPLGNDSLASARFSRIFNLILIKDRTPWRATVSARFRHERCQGLSRGKIGVTEISSMLAPTHAPDMSKLQPSTIEDYEPHHHHYGGYERGGQTDSKQQIQPNSIGAPKKTPPG